MPAHHRSVVGVAEEGCTQAEPRAALVLQHQPREARRNVEQVLHSAHTKLKRVGASQNLHLGVDSGGRRRGGGGGVAHLTSFGPTNVQKHCRRDSISRRCHNGRLKLW